MAMLDGGGCGRGHGRGRYHDDLERKRMVADRLLMRRYNLLVRRQNLMVRRRKLLVCIESGRRRRRLNWSVHVIVFGRTVHVCVAELFFKDFLSIAKAVFFVKRKTIIFFFA